MRTSFSSKTRKTKASARRSLALFGGPKIRNRKMPSRRAFGQGEWKMVNKVFRHYRAKKVDFGYQGDFEKAYTDAFVRYQGGEGYADAVCTGTAALYVAIRSLELKKGSHVLVSPVTDPGTLNAIILNDLVPVLMDSKPGSMNVGVEQFQERISSRIRAVVVVHLGGCPAPIAEICRIARRRGIRVVEDCSQAHGAIHQGRKVGTFGDVAVFSTMFRKIHATGGCGGIIYTRNRALHLLARAHADRGKPYGTDFDDKNPSAFLFPALNLHLDELSCAIGLSSLRRLDVTIRKRLRFVFQLEKALKKQSKTCVPLSFSKNDSPFYQPVFLNTDRLSCTKIEFAKALQAEGIDLNPHYEYVVGEWPWLQKYLGDRFVCANAKRCRNETFNILLNENYDARVVRDIVRAIQKMESVYLK